MLLRTRGLGQILSLPESHGKDSQEGKEINTQSTQDLSQQNLLVTQDLRIGRMEGKRGQAGKAGGGNP